MKKIITIILIANFGISKSQNLGWFKQFNSKTMSAFYNEGVSTNANGDVLTFGAMKANFTNTNNANYYVDFDPSLATANSTSIPVYHQTWVSKLDANGNHQWATLLGNDNFTFLGTPNTGIKAKFNTLGEVIVTSRFHGLTDLDTGPGTYTVTTSSPSQYASFFCKLNANGSFAWAKQFQSNAGNTLIKDLEVDNQNNIYVSGTFQTPLGSPIDFDPSPTATVYVGGAGGPGANGTFITKYDANGNFLWVKTFGTTALAATTLDKNKNLFLFGNFASPSSPLDFDPSVATFTLTSFSSFDPYISKLDSNGNFVWAKQFKDNITNHSSNIDNVRDIVTDNFNNVYVTGQTYDSLDFDPGIATYYLKAFPTNRRDVYAVKLDPNGNFIWAKMFGGTDQEDGTSITLDGNNDIYIGTEFKSINMDFDPSTGTDIEISNAIPSIAVNRLNSNGNYVGHYYFKSSLGNNSPTFLRGLTCTSNNEVITTGEFITPSSFSVDFDPGPGVTAAANLFPGGPDVYLVKLNNLSTGIKNESFAKNNFILYPNPSRGKVIVNVEAISKLSIYNLIGETVYQQPLTDLTTELNLNLIAGIYFVNVTNTEGISNTKKIVIE